MIRNLGRYGVSLLLTQLLAPFLLAARSPPYRFEHLDVEQGLSHASVYTVAEDVTGFLWIGTGDGLNKYDGAGIKVYRHDPADANSLSSSNFGEIAVHPTGEMWFGTWGGGLTRFDPVTSAFRRFLHDPEDPRSLAANRIEALRVGPAGGLWIATETAGLDYFDPATETFVHYRHDPRDPGSLSSDQVKALLVDHSGRLWVGTNGGLDLFQPETATFVNYGHAHAAAHSLSSERVRALVQDRSGDLWVGTRGGLDRLDLETGELRHYRADVTDPSSLSDDAISVLFEDSFGILWIGTYQGGLNRFDPETETFSSYTYDPRDPHSLSHSRVEALYEDRAQNLWIGTRGGLDKLDLKRPKFKTWRHDPHATDSLPHPNVRSIARGAEIDGDDVLWIGTDGGGLSRLDLATETIRSDRFQAVPGSLSSDRVWSVLVDRQGVLWVGTYDAGLNRRAKTGGPFEHFAHDPDDPTTLSSDRVQAIFEDADGVLWLGTADGLNKVVADASGISFRIYKNEPERTDRLSSNYVIVIYQDRAGRLWLGTRDGLLRFDPATSFFQRLDYGTQQSRGTRSVLVIHEDSARQGRLWLGLEGGGLGRIDTESSSLTQYLVEDGLASNFVNVILEDEAGILWLGTSAGITKFDPRSETIENYGLGNGLENYGFNRNSGYAGGVAEMFLGGAAGLTSFFPALVVPNPHAPPVVLTSIKIFNEEMDLGLAPDVVEEIELSYRDNFLSFEFVALEFTSPAHNRYAYRLDDVDGDWVEAGSRRFASYANLAPGAYTFRVKGANNDGVWNEEGMRLRVIVTPPLWRRGWFQAVALVMVVVSAFAAHQTRINVVRSRNARLQEINTRLNQEIVKRERAQRDREHLIARLKEHNTEMEQFTYTVSHDLKSPLFTIQGFLGLLHRDIESGNVKRMSRDLKKIRTAADKMKTLLDELLDLSRIGRKSDLSDKIFMGDLIAEARGLVSGHIKEGKVEIDVAPDMPAVTGDHTRLLQVFQNLIENAVKYMGDQIAPRIEIGWSQDGDGNAPVFYVRDNGRGIAAENLGRVFQLFERIDPEGEGTGVGLAVVKRVVEVHGGRIWVESEGKGRGATFFLTLPR